ncbi:hypothetical protein [Idiomarina ramblicola]|uniref:Uncharacterized protein n=1 Tax=Idiomarina ramblicola TaxID=263724 RepID=A0A432Z5J4_9GAMM|nr:hypothetical protein [Idiomarina ramblicola]RUO73188.1 hypothetical protein CWI78_01735 [Idiomarina ramblicola]
MSYRVNRFLILALLGGAISFSSFASKPKAIDIPYGLWEGIVESKHFYTLLELKQSGEHRLFKLNIKDGFRSGGAVDFTSDDIKCSEYECIIHHKNSERGGVVRLILGAPTRGAVEVMEIQSDIDNQRVDAQSYTLKRRVGSSTFKEHRGDWYPTEEKSEEIEQEGVYGLWLGIARWSNEPALIRLIHSADGPSQFKLYPLGPWDPLTSEFQQDQITLKGEDIWIRTEGSEKFGNEVVLSQKSADKLKGVSVSVPMSFTLFRSKFPL